MKLLIENFKKYLNEGPEEEAQADMYAMFDKYDLPANDEQAVVAAARSAVLDDNLDAFNTLPEELKAPAQELIDLNNKLRGAHGL